MPIVFDYSKLKGKDVEKFGTQLNFIKQISMSEPTFIKKINGEGYFTQKEICEILYVLQVELNEFSIYNYFYCIKS